VADESNLPFGFRCSPVSSASALRLLHALNHAQAARAQGSRRHPDRRAGELVARVNQRWDALESLNATVEIQASVMKSKEGLARDYTTIPGIILLRKPAMLRVYGGFRHRHPRLRYGERRNQLHLVYSLKKQGYQGLQLPEEKSPNQMENMRPEFFFDAMVVRGLDKDDYYSVTADTETVEDAARSISTRFRNTY